MKTKGTSPRDRFSSEVRDGVVELKPFGTMTRDFPFVEPGIREILEEIIEISPDYPEFTKMLCKKAMPKTAASELVLLAIQHATNLSYSELQWKVLDVHGDKIAILPYLLAKKASDDNDWEFAIDAAQDAIDQSKTQWESLMHLLHL